MDKIVHIENYGREIQEIVSRILLGGKEGSFKYYVSEKLLMILVSSCSSMQKIYGKVDTVELEWNNEKIVLKMDFITYNRTYGCSCYRVRKLQKRKETLIISGTKIEDDTMMFCIKNEENEWQND